MKTSPHLLSYFGGLSLAVLGILSVSTARPTLANPDPIDHSTIQMANSSPAPTSTSTVPVDKVTVMIEGFQFKPAQVVLKKGGTVTFINMDSTPHTATPEQGAQFTGTGRLKKGDSKIVTFKETGVQNYFCEIHPSMKGTITVVAK